MAKKKAVSRFHKKTPPPSKATKVRRYEDVLFDFPSDEMRGTVIDRGTEMVLELPQQKGLAPSLIIGKRDGQIFRGVNDIREEDALSISAAWCDFGELFAGVWIEESNELLFSFRLPRKGV